MDLTDRPLTLTRPRRTTPEQQSWSPAPHSTWPMPRLDRGVYWLTGKAMLWLGKRAVVREDWTLYEAMRDALRAGHVAGRLPAKDWR